MNNVKRFLQAHPTAPPTPLQLLSARVSASVPTLFPSLPLASLRVRGEGGLIGTIFGIGSPISRLQSQKWKTENNKKNGKKMAKKKFIFHEKKNASRPSAGRLYLAGAGVFWRWLLWLSSIMEEPKSPKFATGSRGTVGGTWGGDPQAHARTYEHTQTHTQAQNTLWRRASSLVKAFIFYGTICWAASTGSYRWIIDAWENGAFLPL